MSKPKIIQDIENIEDKIDVLSAEVEQEKEGNAVHLAENTTDAHNISNITGLQNSLDAKENTLPEEQKRKITFGTEEPVDLEEGEVYFQYE